MRSGTSWQITPILSYLLSDRSSSASLKGGLSLSPAGGAVKGKIGKQEPENGKEKSIAPQSNGNGVRRRKRFHIRS